MLFNRELEYGCEFKESFGFIENISLNEEFKILSDIYKKINRWDDSDNFSYNFLDYLVGVDNIQDFLFDKIFLVRDNKRNSYFIYLDIEKKILEINNNYFFISE